MHHVLSQTGLPIAQLFVPVTERKTLIAALPGVLDKLEPKVLNRSFYVSKMIAAATVGLFDAALNYLWDELVSELRRRVAGFDLKYFFDIATGGNTDLRKSLKGEEDLTKIDEASLLRASLTIGLITDVGYQRLDHIRYMRNHASAAHPNQVSLTGLDLANWLQICITEVINTPPDTVTANTGRLLANIKNAPLDQPSVDAAAAFFDQLPPDRADTLGNGLFGLYTDPSRVTAADNVRILWPKLWPFVTEDSRSSYGLRHAERRPVRKLSSPRPPASSSSSSTAAHTSHPRCVPWKCPRRWMPSTQPTAGTTTSTTSQDPDGSWPSWPAHKATYPTRCEPGTSGPLPSTTSETALASAPRLPCTTRRCSRRSHPPTPGQPCACFWIRLSARSWVPLSGDSSGANCSTFSRRS